MRKVVCQILSRQDAVILLD